MDTIVTVLNSLEINETFFVQFIYFTILYFIFSALWAGKLQQVVEEREGKTTKLDSEADSMFVKAEKMNEEYEEKILGARVQAQQIIAEKKSDIDAEVKTEVKKIADELEAANAAEKKVFSQELEKKREEILKEADALSKELVNKFV